MARPNLELRNHYLITNYKRQGKSSAVDFPLEIVGEVLARVDNPEYEFFTSSYLGSNDFFYGLDPANSFLKDHKNLGKGTQYRTLYPYFFRSLAHHCLSLMLDDDLVLTQQPKTEGIYDVLVEDGFAARKPDNRPDFLLLKERGKWTEILGASVCASIWNNESLMQSRAAEMEYYRNHGLRHDLLAGKNIEWLERLRGMFTRTYRLPGLVSITESKFKLTYWVPDQYYDPNLERYETENLIFNSLPFNVAVPRTLTTRVMELYTKEGK